jgi:hypothetical protein
MVESSFQLLDLSFALANSLSGLVIVVLSFFACLRTTLPSIRGVCVFHGHHTRAKNTLRQVLGVIIYSLEVLLDNVVLAFIFMRTNENVTSLKIWH